MATIHSARHVHFTGIKGVGMAAAALCVQDLGISVSGSDVAEDFVTKDILKQRNITPSAGFEASAIPPQADVLVYTGAHQGQENQQVLHAQAHGMRVMSQAELVGELMDGKIGVSVCGVGGKTSISAMLANILDYQGLQPSFLIGVGKVLNLQVPGRMSQGAHFIAEADEYIVSPGLDSTPRFMYQQPSLIVCTNVVHDHPDAYPTIDETKQAFLNFFAKVPQDGLLVLNGNSAAIRQLPLHDRPVVFYGHTPDTNDWWVKESYVGDGKQMVIFANKGSEFKLTLSVPGQFNAENALAAYIVARRLGLEHTDIIQALQLFRGSMRRFEKKGEQAGILYYDDYAHHPSQIVATLQAAKRWLPLNRLVTVFQPHTYSRTKVLLDQFAKSFTHSDHVIITDIYATSREAVDETITGDKLAQQISLYHPSVKYVPFDQLSDHLKATLQPQDALFTLGAGNIYQVHDLLLT